MTNTEKLLDAMETLGTPASDDCLSGLAGVEPRQQANQICRRLEASGTVTRETAACGTCGKSKVVNGLGSGRRPAAATKPDAEKKPETATVRVEPEAALNHLDRFCKSLWKERCSGNPPNGIAALIIKLADSGVIPVLQAGLMHTVRMLRNAYVHEHLVFGESEDAVLQHSWRLIGKWAEKVEPDLWRKERR